jgi:uncharacterized protein YjbI with pentapeptide repeats
VGRSTTCGQRGDYGGPVDTRSVGDLKILTPDLDPRDLDPRTELPAGDLTETLVDSVDWSEHHFDTVQVRLSHLRGVSLAQTRWTAATVYGCRFERVDLSGARLTDVTLERCEFVDCRVTGAQLGPAVLKNVIFDGCRLDYTNWTQVRTAGPAAVVHSNLDHAQITRSTLGQFLINGCSLDNLELADCDLRGADLRGNDLSTLTGLASLRGSTLTADQVHHLITALPRELDLTVQ